MRKSASTSEMSTAAESVIDSALKKSPTTPERRPSGANTTTVVSVDPTIGATSSLVAFSTASLPPPSASRRWMFSTTTTASSITRPMATAIPPIDIRLIDSPNSHMTKNVETTVSGRVQAATAVSRQSRRNRSRTTTARAAPMRMASRTLAIALSHELREVVGLLDAQAARQRRLELFQAVLEASPDGEDIGAHLLRDADRRDVAALAGDERRAIGRARC